MLCDCANPSILPPVAAPGGLPDGRSVGGGADERAG